MSANVAIIDDPVMIVKRDGSTVPFDHTKIKEAICAAFKSYHKHVDHTFNIDTKVIDPIADKISKVAYIHVIKHGKPMHIEQIQDLVESKLCELGYRTISEHFAAYRGFRNESRMDGISSLVGMISRYINKSDWRIKENSNQTWSNQGLNNHISGELIKLYWFNEMPTHATMAHKRGDIHIHDLNSLTTYCCGWNMEDLLLMGFSCKDSDQTSSGPARHFDVALGQVFNFLYTLQGEAAGAQAFSSFDIYLAPFIRHDNLSYREVKQHMQKFLHNMNTPTRVGFQTPFTNISLDMVCPNDLKDKPVIIGGEYQDTTFGDYTEEIKMFNKAFAEAMIEGDSRESVFSFPIPTYNLYESMDWDAEEFDPVWKLTGKFGAPYFSNFINSDMDPGDVRSMCCRLKLDNRTVQDRLNKKAAKNDVPARRGGLFNSSPLTGSIGVCTINAVNAAYIAKGNPEAFLKIIETRAEIARDFLEFKREFLEKMTEEGFYPYSKTFLEGVKARTGEYWPGHFSTIGILGMHEAMQQLFGNDDGIVRGEGYEFAQKTLDFLSELCSRFSEDTGNSYNLEASPCEGTTRRLANIDKKHYGDIRHAGTDFNPYYTNSTMLPVGHTADIFEAVRHQEELHTRYDGGTVFHTFIGSSIEDPETVKNLIKSIASNSKLPYISMTPTFSVCKNCGYIRGEHFTCPNCGDEAAVYSRVVGYYRPVKSWNDAKQEEYKERLEYNV